MATWHARQAPRLRRHQPRLHREHASTRATADTVRHARARAELAQASTVFSPGGTSPEARAYHERVKVLNARIEAVQKARREEEAHKARERNARSAAREAAAAEARAAAEKQREEDRALWIAAHGSDFLQKAVGAGYDCQRRYVQERARLEHPEYVPDFDDTANWNERSCPSEAALDEALRVNGTVVWLTSPPARSEDEDFDKCEAVVIRSYLGQYDLIRTYPE